MKAPNHATTVGPSHSPDGENLSASRLSGNSIVTFHDAIASLLVELHSRAEVEPGALGLAKAVAPSQVINALIERGSMQIDQRDDIEKEILAHSNPYPILNRILELIKEESRRATIIQRLETESTGLEENRLNELKVLAATADPQSREQFSKATEAFEAVIWEMKSPDAKGLARNLTNLLLGDSSIRLAEMVTYQVWFSSERREPKTPLSIDSLLESAIEQNWIDRQEKKQIEQSIIGRSPEETTPVLNALRHTLTEVTRRQSRVDTCSLSAQMLGMQIPQELTALVTKVSCSKVDFNQSLHEFERQIQLIEGLDSPAVARWIPADELQRVSGLPPRERLVEAQKIVAECRTLQCLEAFEDRQRAVTQDLLSFKSERGEFIAAGGTLASENARLVHKISAIDFSKACTQEVRSTLVPLALEWVKFEGEVHFEASKLNRILSEAEHEWQSVFNPML